MIAIAAVDENFGIGYKGDLIVERLASLDRSKIMVCTETGETHTMLVDTSDVCREKMEQLLKAK